MDLLDVSRIAISGLYLMMFTVACIVYFNVATFWQKLAAGVAVIITFFWAIFYMVLSLAAPLDGDEIYAASLVSRVIHLPTIAAIGVLLFTVWKQHKTLETLRGSAVKGGP